VAVLPETIATAVYKYGTRKLALTISEDRLALGSSEDAFEVSVPLRVIRQDVQEGLFGGIFASLLLIKPLSVEGDTFIYESLRRDALQLAVQRGLEGLKRRYSLLFQHLEVLTPFFYIAELSRYTRALPWIRSLASAMLSESGVLEWMSREVVEALSHCTDLPRAEQPIAWIRVAEVEPCSRGRPIGFADRVAAVGKAAQALVNLQVSIVAPFGLLAEGVKVRLHPLLRDPLLLARLGRCKVATKLLDFEDHLHTIIGIKEILSSARRESLIRSVKVVRGPIKAVVVKRYRDYTAAKWLAALVLTPHLPKPRGGPRSRMEAEYHYNTVLYNKGFLVPNPLLLDLRRLISAYEFVEGEDLLKLLNKSPAPPPYRDLGCTLAQVHKAGVSLWDANPSNFIATSRGIYIVDLEQARELRSVVEAAWDLAVATFYSIPFNISGATTRAKLIAEGYVSCGGDPGVVFEASKPRYALPFIPVSPPNVLERVRRTLLRIAGANGS
jgi:tRNA A-37 threonylcarbamoyl transferase component Bud32